MSEGIACVVGLFLAILLPGVDANLEPQNGGFASRRVHRIVQVRSRQREAVSLRVEGQCESVHSGSISLILTPLDGLAGELPYDVNLNPCLI
jgi:hypothetical protein